MATLEHALVTVEEDDGGTPVIRGFIARSNAASDQNALKHLGQAQPGGHLQGASPADQTWHAEALKILEDETDTTAGPAHVMLPAKIEDRAGLGNAGEDDTVRQAPWYGVFDTKDGALYALRLFGSPFKTGYKLEGVFLPGTDPADLTPGAETDAMRPNRSVVWVAQGNIDSSYTAARDHGGGGNGTNPRRNW